MSALRGQSLGVQTVKGEEGGRGLQHETKVKHKAVCNGTWRPHREILFKKTCIKLATGRILTRVSRSYLRSLSSPLFVIFFVLRRPLRRLAGGAPGPDQGPCSSAAAQWAQVYHDGARASGRPRPQAYPQGFQEELQVCVVRVLYYSAARFFFIYFPCRLGCGFDSRSHLGFFSNSAQ